MIEPKTKEFWRAILALSLGAWIIYGNIYTTQPILPILAEEFGVLPSLTSLSVSVVIFSLSLALLFYGTFTDGVVRKKFMYWTMLGAVVVTFIIFFVNNFKVLIFLRGVQGFFLAGLPAVAVAYIGEEFAAGAISIAVGIYISATTIGGLTGRLISGFVTDSLGWRYSFLTLSIISFICLSFFHLLLPNTTTFVPRKTSRKKGMTIMGNHISNPILVIPFCLGALICFVFMGLYNYVTFLLSQSPFNLPPAVIGLLFFTHLAGTMSSLASGFLSTRIGLLKSINIGLAIMAAGIMVTLIPLLSIILLGLSIMCFGFFITHSTLSSWISQNAHVGKASATGLYLIFYFMGGSLGGTLLGFVWEHAGWVGIVWSCIGVLGAAYILNIFLACKNLSLKREKTVYKS